MNTAFQQMKKLELPRTSDQRTVAGSKWEIKWTLDLEVADFSEAVLPAHCRL
jgi:hypothetical protein